MAQYGFGGDIVIKKDENVAFQELKASIREKNIGSFYVFYGEEMFLLRHYLGQVKKILIDELTESFNYHRFNHETFDVQAFADAVENLPMMAQRTMVQVDDVDLFKLSEDERNKMAQLLSDIADYCTVIFTYETVAWKLDKRYKKLSDVICDHAKIVEFAKQNQRDLIAWITRHFAVSKKTISTDLCAYLIDITDGTMTSLSGEISKICAYSGGDVIKKSDIDAVTEPVLDAVVFQISDLLAQGKYPQALQKLEQLIKMQQEPLAILGAIGTHFRRIGTAKTLLDNGKGSAELQKLLDIRDYAARKTMDSARHFTPQFCHNAVNLILQTDYRIKTSFDDANRLLEMLLLQLAQEARNG